MTLLLVLEATRRTLGLALPILALCFVAYALSGPWLPGPLRHKGLTYEILIDQTFFTTEGLFGIPLGVAASYVILFIIFGAFLEQSGAGQFFMNFANAIAGGSAGGPARSRWSRPACSGRSPARPSRTSWWTAGSPFP